METPAWNSYTFGSLRALRQLLRSYEALKVAAQDDATSATILLDLSRALGEDPGSRVSILTDRQAQAVRLSLIMDLPAPLVARQMGLSSERVVYLMVNNALRRLLRFLQNGETPKTWQPWQVEYVTRNAHLPREILAEHVGRSSNSVGIFLSRKRRNGELIEFGQSGRRASCRRSSAQVRAETASQAISA